MYGSVSYISVRRGIGYSPDLVPIFQSVKGGKMGHVNEPVSITLKMHGHTYTAEGLDWDSDALTLKNAFECLMVCAGFSPSIIEVEGGHYEWVAD